MSTVHLYGAHAQPATRWFIDVGWPKSKRIWIRCTGGSLRWCRKCGKRRRARNLIVHAYYDDVRHFCKPGKGCKA